MKVGLKWVKLVLIISKGNFSPFTKKLIKEFKPMMIWENHNSKVGLIFFIIPKIKDGEMLFLSGNTDFFQTLGRKKGVFWVDNTKFIVKLEKTKSNAFVWLRPRRFGKSFFLCMLDAYYNILYKDKFQDNFGHLYIGKHPTPEQGSYFVLNLNFATLDTSSVELFHQSLHGFINDACIAFSNMYDTNDITIHENNSVRTMNSLIEFIKKGIGKVK